VQDVRCKVKLSLQARMPLHEVTHKVTCDRGHADNERHKAGRSMHRAQASGNYRSMPEHAQSIGLRRVLCTYTLVQMMTNDLGWTRSFGHTHPYAI